jgi:hypothetical protein
MLCMRARRTSEIRRGRDGHERERGAAGDGAPWSLAVWQGRVDVSDARAPFHYAGTDSLDRIVFVLLLRANLIGWTLAVLFH